MSEFDLPLRRSGDLRATRAAAAAEPSALSGLRGTTASSLPVYVDVGSRKIESQIERDGVPIGVLPINKEILEEAILVRPILQVKVVSQSVPAGTPVPVGTTVDLVMAAPGRLPVGVVSGVHDAFKEFTIADAHAALVADNPLVNRIVTHATEGQLSAEDANAVKEIFSNANVEVTDEPGKDLNAAVATLSMLKTFGV
jgi:hypothetical protein